MADGSEPHAGSEPAFAFGKNWSDFLSRLDDTRIAAAEQSLISLLNRNELTGCRFLDAGSGSGLFSLAAFRLGASVVSFDIDADSVACTQHLQKQFGTEERTWDVQHGSLLDEAFLEHLGMFDVVYCWGVAHHTGSMWQAVDHLAERVRPGGCLVLAIYNDQQYVSRLWRGIKKIYQKLPGPLRPVLTAGVGVVLFVRRLVVTCLAMLLRLVTLRNPLVPASRWIRETQGRGMHRWYDLVDWVGGWPFETARPEDVFRFLRDRGFRLQELTTTPGHGCNEFVFVRPEDAERPDRPSH